MGVDYRSTVGYGFVIPDEECEALAERLAYPESEWGFDAWEFGNWLVEGTSLVSEYVGNLMSGEDIHLMIVAGSTYMSADPYYDSGIKKFANAPQLKFEEVKDLHLLWSKVYPGTGIEVGWLLAMSIS